MRKSTKKLEKALDLNRSKAQVEFYNNSAKYYKFMSENRVEITYEADFQYYCWINHLCYAIELTHIEALVNGINNFLKELKSNSIV
jgi:hypothetical protein